MFLFPGLLLTITSGNHFWHIFFLLILTIYTHIPSTNLHTRMVMWTFSHDRILHFPFSQRAVWMTSLVTRQIRTAMTLSTIYEPVPEKLTGQIWPAERAIHQPIATREPLLEPQHHSCDQASLRVKSIALKVIDAPWIELWVSKLFYYHSL